MHSLKDIALQVNKSCLKTEDKEQTDQNNVTQSLPWRYKDKKSFIV